MQRRKLFPLVCRVLSLTAWTTPNLSVILQPVIQWFKHAIKAINSLWASFVVSYFALFSKRGFGNQSVSVKGNSCTLVTRHTHSGWQARQEHDLLFLHLKKLIESQTLNLSRTLPVVPPFNSFSRSISRNDPQLATLAIISKNRSMIIRFNCLSQ